MGEEPTESLVGKLIAHATTVYPARAKGVATRLFELGYTGPDGAAYSQQAISAWKTRGTGLQAGPFLALAHDLKLDLNALLYRGEIVGYDPERDLEASLRRLREATEQAQRLLNTSSTAS